MTDPASVPQSKSAGEFRLDVEGARAAVTALEDVERRLIALRRQAHELSRQASTDRSVQDLISLEALDLLAQKAEGGSGSLADALDGGITHVRQLVRRGVSRLAMGCERLRYACRAAGSA